MLDDINQRKLERELTMLLTAVFGCSSPTNNTIASIQASELLEEMRVLAETESMHYEQQKESVMQLGKLLGLSYERMEALFTAYALPR